MPSVLRLFHQFIITASNILNLQYFTWSSEKHAENAKGNIIVHAE